ncbi:MAG: hypothetical protein LUH56_01575 [Oscillospiraceae bacterium]|nr:hypothetical protein [Oscillospiraceae bacterium]
MTLNIKKALCIMLAAMLTVTMAVTAFADDPYTSYNYNAWKEAVPSQNGYQVTDTITGADIGLDQLSDPDSEFFISEDEPATLSDSKDFFLCESTEEWYIVDTGNNRIIKTDLEFNLLACFKTFTGSSMTTETTLEDGTVEVTEANTLKSPYGIYVDDDGIMYIADRDNQRVIKCNQDCEIITEYTRPDSELYDSVSFYCTKVLVDAAKNVYVICPAVNKGAIMYSASGTFLGYFGANKVEVTAQVVINKMWRKIATESQSATLTKATPVEYANFDIDDQGFIYTVTEAANTTTDAVKKLNPAGENIIARTENGAEIVFGDQTSVTYSGTTYSTRLTDISIGDNGIVNILDYTSGRIFQYDREFNLLFIFGCDQEDQNGGFDNPNAIESYGDKIYVLDGRNNDITVFSETLFGTYVHEAAEMYNEGLYEESLELWQEILKRDGNYNMAYVAIGKALLNQDEYEEAMKYLKAGYDDEDYDKAFEYYRKDLMRNNFTAAVIVIAVLIVLYIVVRMLQKRGKIPDHLWKRLFRLIGKGIKTLANKIVGVFTKNKKGGAVNGL